MRIGETISKLATKTLTGAVRFYQCFISPYLGRNKCRFEPSCSEYMILAVEKYGLIPGFVRGIGRICRCHPFGACGHDPP